MQARAKRKASDQGSAAPQESSAIDAASKWIRISRGGRPASPCFLLRKLERRDFIS